MNVLSRIEHLAAILQAAGGEVIGKKKFQKIVYLTQEMGLYLGYDYGYHFHGVFCPEIEADLRIGESFGIIQQEEIAAKGNPVRIALTDSGTDYSTQIPPQIRVVLEGLATEESRVLEVASTIVYLERSGYAGGALESHLERLKGHLSQFFPQARNLHSQLFSS